MEKNEAFRNKVLSRLYGLPDPTEGTDTESNDTAQEDSKETDTDNAPVPAEQQNVKKNKESSPVRCSPVSDADTGEQKNKDDIKQEHTNSSGEDKTSPATSDAGSSKTNNTSHLYTALMAPLDERGSSYKTDWTSSSCKDETGDLPRKKLRLETFNEQTIKTELLAKSDNFSSSQVLNTNSSVGMDLTKNQKRKLKKKRRKSLLSKLEIQRAKEFIYSEQKEQYSVEKLRTMIEDVTEFIDAIWDVYCSEARLRGENVEEDRYQVAAVLKCLSASGEGSWVDLQLLSRAKSVLVLRSKTMAASTISRVENELGYDSDIRSFIVRMLRFWMNEVVTKA